MKPTVLTMTGLGKAKVEPDAPSAPVYLLSVYVQRDSVTLCDQVQGLVVRSEPQASRHRGEVIALLRRSLWREEQALRGGLVPSPWVDVARGDVLPGEDLPPAAASGGSG